MLVVGETTYGIPVPYKLKIKVNYSHETSKSSSTKHWAFAVGSVCVGQA